MAYQQQNQSPHHRLRYYIIMTTVVVLGLFVLLFFNNSNSLGITSAVVENVKDNSLIESITNGRLGSTNQNAAPEAKRISPSANNIEFLLLSSAIPRIAKETKMETITIIFNDLSAPITVNEDKLELSGLSQVTLGLAEFSGTVEIDERQFSLDGLARKFEVNGISLSSASEIKISFKGLNYQRAIITNAEFNGLEFVTGEGSVQIGSRLRYSLENGQLVTIYNYFGDLQINKDLPAADLNSTIEDTGTQLQGYANGLDIVNGALNLNLR